MIYRPSFIPKFTRNSEQKHFWGIVGDVLKVAPKIRILGPGAIFSSPPKGSKYKISFKKLLQA